MEDNICPICYDLLDDSDKSLNKPIKLKCGHKFHYDCIMTSYKTEKMARICPFCRMDGGYLKLKENTFPIKHIHYEYREIKKCIINNDFIKLAEISEKYIDKSKCHSIIKTGLNMGTQCKKHKQKNSNYCYIHNKFHTKFNY